MEFLRMQTVLNKPVQFGQAFKLLMVDDDPDVLDLTVPHIKKIRTPQEDTFEVQTAGSLEEAKELLTQNTYDVVVTDNSMPARNQGIELIRFIQTLAIKPVVWMFSNDEDAANEAKNNGAQGFIKKGWNSTSLINTLKEWLSNRQLLQSK